jgi:hypothetical protein
MLNNVHMLTPRDVSAEGEGLERDNGRIGEWSQTWTGGRFYVEAPLPRDVDILDIAFALGNTARYNGQCRFYSVAEHSVLVSKLVPEHLAFQGLMHDATEAYINDLVRPVKRAIGERNVYYRLEQMAWGAIAQAFGLPLELDPAVKYADTQICKLEKARLHPRAGRWNLPMPMPELTIYALTPELAQLGFLKRFCELSGEPFGILEEMYWHFRRQDDRAFYALQPIEV